MDLTRPLLVLALALPTLALATPAHAACSGDVMVQNPYSPTSKEVAPGTTVTWCWTENNHSVTSDAVGGFDSGVRNTDATFQQTLNATVTYHCTIHSNMHGTIVVKQPTTPSPTKPVSHSPTPSRTTTAPATRTPSPTPSRTATLKPTPTPTPTPTATTAPPTTAPPTTVAPTTLAPTTTSPTPLVLDPPPAKPKTGLALVLGSVVAVGALGGAAWLFLKGRAG